MAGFNWSDIITAVLGYMAADKASEPGKVNNTITPQAKEIFDRIMGMADYSPTREYGSEYIDSFLRSANAPGGILDYKPQFQSEYMKGQQLPDAPKVDMANNPYLQGGFWRRDYDGPVSPGAKTPKQVLGGNRGGVGGRTGGGRGFNRDIDIAPSGGDWSEDYYNNPYNFGVGGGGFGTTPGFDPNNPGDVGRPRDEFGAIITVMNDGKLTDYVKPNGDGTVSITFPNGPSTRLTEDEWRVLAEREAAFQNWVVKNAMAVKNYAKEHGMDMLSAAVKLFLTMGVV